MDRRREASPWFTAPEYAKYRQPGNVKLPFWLQPEKYYAGRGLVSARYGDSEKVERQARRAFTRTTALGNARLGGQQTHRHERLSLSTPHEYDLGQLSPGKHTISIRVDNRMIVDIGENSHAVSDHTQGNWNGIVGNIALRATPLLWLEDVQVYPDAAGKSALVKNWHDRQPRPASRAAANWPSENKPPRSVGTRKAATLQ